jgi:putative nucleotidyltransferase with HDIG domain
MTSHHVAIRRTPSAERWLPLALLATAFVVIAPALAVWAVLPPGEPALLVISVPLGMLLSVLAARLGTALWKRTPGSRDIVFADLMLWGWLRRCRTERRLAQAETLLGRDAEGMSVEALTRLSALLEARDGYTYGHSQRVTRHAERIARAMGLSGTDVAKVRTAAALHDVGKLHTPREILNKPGRLTEEEFEVIRRHPGDGAAMATGLGDPMIIAMIRHHHERLDGKGYPDGLAGEQIPLGARIIAVADTFDAITSDRAYRRASSHKRALDVLAREAGTQLDADAVAGFVGYYRGLPTVAWSAFVTAAPQRLLAWLGGLTPSVGAGAAGAAALLIGIGTPQPPVASPILAAIPKAPLADAPRAAVGTAADTTTRARRSSRPDATRDPSARQRRAGRIAPRARTPAPVTHEPAHTPAPTATPSPQKRPGGQGSEPNEPIRPGLKPLPSPSPRPILPEVRVPALELPSVDLPAVDLPLIELPGVRVPPLEVPSLPLPTLSGHREGTPAIP